MTRHDAIFAGGHFGISKTYSIVARDFWWPRMRSDIRNYVQSCEECQRSKTSRHKPYGALTSPQVPTDRWTDVTMDFIGPLPESHGFTAILVVVDRFTKMAHFIGCGVTVDAKETARLFLDNIIRLHGLQNRSYLIVVPNSIAHSLNSS